MHYFNFKSDKGKGYMWNHKSKSFFSEKLFSENIFQKLNFSILLFTVKNRMANCNI